MANIANVDNKTKAKNAKAKAKNSPGKGIKKYFKDLKAEIKKVVWPTKKQVKNNTLIVLSFMAIAAVVLWTFDALLGFIMNLIFGA